jgi:thioredoxin reductase
MDERTSPPKINFLLDSVITEFEGQDLLEGVTVKT